MFEATTQKLQFADVGKWYYTDYLPKEIGGAVKRAPIEKRSGGLGAIQTAGDDVLTKKTKTKVVLNPERGLLRVTISVGFVTLSVLDEFSESVTPLHTPGIGVTHSAFFSTVMESLDKQQSFRSPDLHGSVQCRCGHSSLTAYPPSTYTTLPSQFSLQLLSSPLSEVPQDLASHQYICHSCTLHLGPLPA